MTKTISFPTPENIANHRSQADQIIVIANAVTSFELGGPATYVDVSAWKRDDAVKAAPYTTVVLEFYADAAITLGDGSAADEIGLFGEIDGVGKVLLGVLGIGMGNTMPQIPIISPIVSATDLGIGFAQTVCNVAVYDRLAIGGIAGEILFVPEDTVVTVIARPIFIRDFGG